MGVFHRKLFRPSNETVTYPCLDCSMTYCPPECNLVDDDDDDDDAPPPYPPPLPPLPPLPPGILPLPPGILPLPLHPALDRSSDHYENPNPDQKHQVSPIVIIVIVILASCFLLVSYYAIIVKFWGSWRESRRRRRRDSQNQPPEETHEDFIDENHGPIVDHPIWFITTVGLEQSIINAITVCKYKKGEGLIEGTECSVCLNEFHEDETLRLLPKCSHAFHLPCIDTWLRSHKNCPLCRAPIVSNPVTVRATSTAVVPVSNSSDSREATIVENSESDDGLEVNQQMVSESRIGVEDERELELQESRRDINITKEIVPCPPPNNGFRGLSDLGDNHRTSVENGIQPVRRSVSMDLSMFCLSIPSSVPVEGGSSNAEPVVGKDSNSSIVLKSPSGSANIFRLMGSSSIGGFLQRGPVSMKRSFSNGEKLSRSRRSQSSNLPL